MTWKISHHLKMLGIILGKHHMHILLQYQVLTCTNLYSVYVTIHGYLEMYSVYVAMDTWKYHRKCSGPWSRSFPTWTTYYVWFTSWTGYSSIWYLRSPYIHVNLSVWSHGQPHIVIFIIHCSMNTYPVICFEMGWNEFILLVNCMSNAVLA